MNGCSCFPSLWLNESQFSVWSCVLWQCCTVPHPQIKPINLSNSVSSDIILLSRWCCRNAGKDSNWQASWVYLGFLSDQCRISHGKIMNIWCRRAATKWSLSSWRHGHAERVRNMAFQSNWRPFSTLLTQVSLTTPLNSAMKYVLLAAGKFLSNEALSCRPWPVH